MKLKYNFIIFIALILLTTGCLNDIINNNITKLNCTLVNQDEINTEADISVSFKDDKLNDAKMEYVIVFSQDELNYIDAVYNMLEQDYTEYNSYKGISATLKREETTITSTMHYNFNEMEIINNKFVIPDSDDEIDKDITYEGMKKLLEDDGFLCN